GGAAAARSGALPTARLPPIVATVISAAIAGTATTVTRCALRILSSLDGVGWSTTHGAARIDLTRSGRRRDSEPVDDNDVIRAAPLLEARGIQKHFGHVVALAEGNF